MGAKLTPLVVLNKPAKLAPCNGCGYCCHEEACTVSIEYLNSDVAPCIALEWNGQRFECGMMTRPRHYLGIKFPEADEVLIPLLKKYLGEGQGCSCDDPE
jgi:hypothetical protein